ncbi:diaminobutyrate--2-oxoglutarate transaminase [Thiomicrorhabdus sp. 6S2-11]|uniref:Diaminobutyrate--2-oxoglutarate transaminase n=1 Tax=Thiomicrorhabdus marina TaxID=2818442 RepID=A0ABS3Q8G1_9GAMM|nr:diaminobutyrate--2-oxoglutarate transaminase [Thiomicrorhabdus marina]MBO1928224.1 diaminobutyrate--2-oxoglutarate transaminase [Thiomicrorhabdus marina]
MDWFETYESDIRAYSRMYPAVFVKGDNARQTDEEGKTYIDFYAGAGVLNFGHNNPKMTQAMVDYLQNGGVIHSLDMMTPPKRDFIQAFVETILKPKKMDYKLQFMGPTGTNAMEAALKLARKVTGRELVVSFTQGFHGMTLGALACTANRYFRDAAGVSLQNVMRWPFENHQGGGLESLQTLRSLFENSSSGISAPAAFVVEVVQAEGGVNVASTEWMQVLQSLAHDLGALLIVDDIQAGCGRTGNYFSFEEMGIKPDIVTLAKGIGGMGTPMAMNLVKPEHDKHWQPGEHTGTFRGQNLSFIAGREALRYFDDDTLMQTTRKKGEVMRQALQVIADSYPDKSFEVRGKGMMQALDIKDGVLSKAIAKDCFENGMLFGPCGIGGEVMKLIPPLTIPDEDLQKGLTLFKEAVDRQIKLAAKKVA